MKDAINTSYDWDVINGDAESRGQEPALAVNGSYAPYNVFDGDNLKNRNLMFAEQFKDGKTSAAPNLLYAKGTGNRLSGESEIKRLVGKGEQYTNGRRNRLKTNMRYQAGEYDYFYETDGAGRISKFETDNLQLTTREKRLSHSRNTPGKVKGQDHAGHLAGDRFWGSPKIDNLVSQLSADVNLKQYKKIEDEWAAALSDKPPKKITVDVEILYKEIDVRPKTFIVNYTIDGKSGFKIIEN